MSNKTYKINKMKQLIDLNGDYKNFEVSFTAKTKDNSVFDAVVVSQDKLDNGEQLEYRKADGGFISGNFRSNDNKEFTNYFLVLKCDKPTDCVVTINNRPIDMHQQPRQQPHQQQPHQQQPHQQQPHQQPQQPHQQPQQQQQQQQQQKSNSIIEKIKENWKLIVGICVICITLYYFYSNYPKVESGSLNSNLIENKMEKEEPVNFIGSPTPSSVMSYSSNNSEESDDILNFF